MKHCRKHFRHWRNFCVGRRMNSVGNFCNWVLRTRESNQNQSPRRQESNPFDTRHSFVSLDRSTCLFTESKRLMSLLQSVIGDWRAWRAEQCRPTTGNFRDLFNEVLGLAPYYLRYSLDPKHGSLLLIHPTEESEMDNRVVQECNGIIVDSTTFAVIAQGMNTVIDAPESWGFTTGTEFANAEWDQGTFYAEEAEDGTVLKVFHYNGEWIVSTNRRIDASRVRWCSPRSFYDPLCDVLQTAQPSQVFEKYLDKTCTYSFVLNHPENYLVVFHLVPSLVFVSKRDMKTGIETATLDKTFNAGVDMPWRGLQILGKDD
ncbi:hypothetical protein BJ741DRAFT_119240 [Chytriomyces cf. hyalinus JEL632]|nr:hypothetical protein BJ741DRAFT_119240 [Chytriomyces cf. hyalinus JEL632]